MRNKSNNFDGHRGSGGLGSDGYRERDRREYSSSRQYDDRGSYRGRDEGRYNDRSRDDYRNIRLDRDDRSRDYRYSRPDDYHEGRYNDRGRDDFRNSRSDRDDRSRDDYRYSRPYEPFSRDSSRDIDRGSNLRDFDRGDRYSIRRDEDGDKGNDSRRREGEGGGGGLGGLSEIDYHHKN